ncbi:patatin-like phospholipase family protein [Arachnia propionica]|uniref:Patatin-like phospholipase family protein n=1 Tax=Arachnia propionica TaxID=1750 RepID=A0A3P1T9Z7_9ACTN|nr:patatin-like phospholipase family protein [Arachnia propionica]RRD06247.1 patatin-like phospholipase family protein [Arachnia propionica]
MAGRGWFGIPFFDRQPQATTTGCVLSGGGSRASFQIGALGYLYANDPDFVPTTFIGTSAGAILAAGLAQYGDVAGQRRFLARIDELWCGMRDFEEMFTPRPWLARILAEAPAWMELVGQNGRTQEPQRSWLPLRRRRSGTVEPEGAEDPVTEALTPDEEPESASSLGLIAQLAGNLGRLPKLGGDLVAARAGLEQSRSMYRPGPVLAQLLDPETFDPERVRSSGMELRIAMVALESGHLHFMRQDGAMLNRENQLLDPGPHHLTRGVLASCALPGVFRPVPIGAETYIDGGARENLPAEMAIGHLQLGRTYVVSSQLDGVPRRASMAESDIFQVVMRATEILMDESCRDEQAYAHSAGAIVIAPEVDVHDAMTVEPGLLRIFRDHGWSRAAAVIQGVGPEDAMRANRVTELRVQALRREEDWLEQPGERRRLVELSSAKLELRDAIARCPADLLNQDAVCSWREFEAHRQSPGVPAPWLDR